MAILLTTWFIDTSSDITVTVVLLKDSDGNSPLFIFNHSELLIHISLFILNKFDNFI